MSYGLSTATGHRKKGEPFILLILSLTVLVGSWVPTPEVINEWRRNQRFITRGSEFFGVPSDDVRAKFRVKKPNHWAQCRLMDGMLTQNGSDSAVL